MVAADPNANTFTFTFRTVDPKLDELRANWTRSAPDRTQYQGPLIHELDYYYNTASDEIGGLLQDLRKPKSPEEVKALAERAYQLTNITDGVANFLFRHILNER